MYISPSMAFAFINNVKQVQLTTVARHKLMTAGKIGNCHHQSANKQNTAGEMVQHPHDEASGYLLYIRRACVKITKLPLPTFTSSFYLPIAKQSIRDQIRQAPIEIH